MYFFSLLINDPAHQRPCFPACVLAGKVLCTAGTNMSQVCFHLPSDLNPDSSTFVYNDYHTLWDLSPVILDYQWAASTDYGWRVNRYLSASLIEMVNVKCFCEAKLMWNANMHLVSVLPLNNRCQMLWEASLIRLMSHKTCVLQPCKNRLAANFSVWLSANDQMSMWQTWKQPVKLTADDLRKVICKENTRVRQEDWHMKHNAVL